MYNFLKRNLQKLYFLCIITIIAKTTANHVAVLFLVTHIKQIIENIK